MSRNRRTSTRLTSFLVTLGLSLGAGEGFAGPRSFSLEQIMSAPFPSGLVAAPSAGKLAWVFNDQGERNIWIAAPPDYEGRAVTSYSGDDGQDLGGLAWTPDADAMVYVRGGNANRQGEYPNPLSHPEGVEQRVWVLSADGGEPLDLGQGSSPAVSPKHGRVTFLKEGQIWWAPLDGGSPAAQLVHARGRAHSLRWSPDGSRLAFVSERGDHGFIGVYHWEERTLRYLDPGVDRDSEPVWSPDGERIAFVRFPRPARAACSARVGRGSRGRSAWQR